MLHANSVCACVFFILQKQMKGSPDRIQACTTTHFDGSIAVVDPEKSWVARWQRTSAFFFPSLRLFLFVCGVLIREAR